MRALLTSHIIIICKLLSAKVTSSLHFPVFFYVRNKINYEERKKVKYLGWSTGKASIMQNNVEQTQLGAAALKIIIDNGDNYCFLVLGTNLFAPIIKSYKKHLTSYYPNLVWQSNLQLSNPHRNNLHILLLTLICLH